MLKDLGFRSQCSAAPSVAESFVPMKPSWLSHQELLRLLDALFEGRLQPLVQGETLNEVFLRFRRSPLQQLNQPTIQIDLRRERVEARLRDVLCG